MKLGRSGNIAILLILGVAGLLAILNQATPASGGFARADLRAGPRRQISVLRHAGVGG